MPRNRLPPNCAVANLDGGPARIGVIAKERKIPIGDTTLVRDSLPDTIDRISKPHDWVDWLGVSEQFEVRFPSNQTDLSSPSKKRRQRHTAKRILERLREEHRDTGGTRS